MTLTPYYLQSLYPCDPLGAPLVPLLRLAQTSTSDIPIKSLMVAIREIKFTLLPSLVLKIISTRFGYFEKPMRPYQASASLTQLL